MLFSGRMIVTVVGGPGSSGRMIVTVGSRLLSQFRKIAVAAKASTTAAIAQTAIGTVDRRRNGITGDMRSSIAENNKDRHEPAPLPHPHAPAHKTKARVVP